MACNSSRKCSLLGEDQCPKMFRYVVGIAVDDTGWLPTHEMALWILAEAVNAIEVSPPPSASDHLFFADRAQRHARRCIPYVILFIDSSHASQPELQSAL